MYHKNLFLSLNFDKNFRNVCLFILAGLISAETSNKTNKKIYSTAFVLFFISKNYVMSQTLHRNNFMSPEWHYSYVRLMCHPKQQICEY